VNAIFPDSSVPAEWAAYGGLNALWYKDKAGARAQVDTWKPR